MTAVRRTIEVAGTVGAAEALWYDVDRWPAWVDGFGSLVERRDPWPRTGGEVAWRSGPYGRGSVTERASWFGAGEGQTVDFEDDRMTGRQSVAFTPAESGGGTSVTLSFDYAIKQARPGMFIVDLLFIRRAVGDSLRRTLEAFAAELAPAALR